MTSLNHSTSLLESGSHILPTNTALMHMAMSLVLAQWIENHCAANLKLWVQIQLAPVFVGYISMMSCTIAIYPKRVPMRPGK